MDNEHIYSIKKSDTEDIRLTVRLYKGKKYLDIRAFYVPENGNKMIPTKKGITMSIMHLEELAKGLQKVTTQLQ